MSELSDGLWGRFECPAPSASILVEALRESLFALNEAADELGRAIDWQGFVLTAVEGGFEIHVPWRVGY